VFLMMFSYSDIGSFLRINLFLIVFIVVLYVPNSNIHAQINYVPNGSFETYSQCPNVGGEIQFAAPWKGPTINSSDYYNSCSSVLNVPYYGGTTNQYPYFLDAYDG